MSETHSDALNPRHHPRRRRPMSRLSQWAAAALILAGPVVQAQDAVIPVRDAESLFTSQDPRLHANKQVVYHIIRNLLESGRWSRRASS
jgi:hypothetical protein